MSGTRRRGRELSLGFSRWIPPLNQTATDFRAGCLARAQSAEGCRSRTANEEIRQAYASLAKSWAELAQSIPAADEKQPH